MNLSLRKAGTLLVAGLAFAACSPDSDDSVLTPPTGFAVAEDGYISVKVCKVIVDPEATDSKLANEDVDGFGEEVFFETNQGNFSLLAGNGTGPNPTVDCTDDSVDRDWKTDEILVPVGTDFEVTELATTGSGGTVAISSVSLIPFNGIENCPNLVGFTATLTDVGNNPCTVESGEPYKLVFKNLFTEGEDETGEEGCTPGAWRNQDGTGNNGKNRWDNLATYNQTDSFATVFGVDLNLLAGLGIDPSLTLRQALDLNSNDDGTAFLKHATAALLNADADGVAYPISTVEVISRFQAVYPHLVAQELDSVNAQKDEFDAWNNLGCPI